MQPAVPSWFSPIPKHRYGRSDSDWNVSRSFMELTIDRPSCSSCGERIFRMQAIRRNIKLLGAMIILNFLIYVLVSRSHSQGKYDSDRPNLPDKEFWKKPELSNAAWNRQQQHIDHSFNPLYVSALAASNMSMTELPQYLQNHTSSFETCQPDQDIALQIKDFGSLPQRFKDFLLYMRCRTYPMLINAPDVCSQTPFLLLAIKSLAPHFDRRQAIRQSWGRAGSLSNHRVATVFLLGNTVATDHFPDLSAMVQHEAALYGDVLQWDYRDSFFNLTLKEVLFLEWLGDHCSGTYFVFKGDDDVFVNTHRILHYLDTLSKKKAWDLFVGDVITNAGPHRDKKLKYYIPESVYTGSYPPYAGGGGYLYSGELALRLRNISRHVSMYPIDDVYTGMCLQKLGLVPEKHNEFRTFNIEEKHRQNACIYKNLMLVHPRSPQEVIQIWNWINDPGLKCSS